MRPVSPDGFDGPVPQPPTDWTTVDAAIDAADAAGFVAVGGRFDPGLRYLTRVAGADREYAVVRANGASVLCAPRGAVQAAEETFDGRVATERVGDPAGERAAAVLDGADGGATAGSTVVVPPTIPHDAAVYLERAGYDLQSTTAVSDARAVKADAEVDAIRAVQRAAATAIRRVERLLAAAEVGDDGVRRDGTPLTVERLRRATNAALAEAGVTDAGNTVVATGPGRTKRGAESPADDRDTDAAAPISATGPVAIGVAPRGPHGYHGSTARTFVVDSDGGWERRAYVAVESALDAGLDAIEAGAVAADVGRAVDAELAAFGFGSADDIEWAGAAAPGCGVGLERVERPSLRGDSELAAGNVVAVEPRVVDPEHGVVRLREAVVVRAGGAERLDGGDRAFTPRS
jgi:Xaa-Pro aminopeptidase